MMLEAALYSALGCAFISALAGVRTAWVLLASVAFCLAIDRLGVPFVPLRWLTIDAAAIAAIVLLGRLDRQAWAIIALFPVAWAFYLSPDPYRYIGSMTVTIAQLVLTFPAADAWERARHATRHAHRPSDPFDDFDIQAAA